MKTVDDWFREYGESHQNHTNKILHWVCIPLIMFSLIGLLWILPIPGLDHEVANVGFVFLLASLGYYLRLSVPLALGMTVIASVMVAILVIIERHSTWPLWQICLAIFVLAWVGQFIGHKIEGKKPSFFQDHQFLLIGPLWLLGFIYRRVGIRY